MTEYLRQNALKIVIMHMTKKHINTRIKLIDILFIKFSEYYNAHREKLIGSILESVLSMDGGVCYKYSRDELNVYNTNKLKQIHTLYEKEVVKFNRNYVVKSVLKNWSKAILMIDGDSKMIKLAKFIQLNFDNIEVNVKEPVKLLVNDAK